MRTKEKFQELAPGDVLILETEHARAVRNILDWACREGFTIDVDEEGAGVWQVRIEK
ncbi:sulfurtransferase TusA family protein [Metallumcola ferriviriculae]|uniref:Sulfurtransferase TusA family protein n=1 Tax=Metallumcola ferriviriculae TaxID=3039180 RepID=A0AAU0UPB8_9FIRM|nr:sulfurtransferase TusA family protein [Desulfitibacteraceae bacterium MK1]